VPPANTAQVNTKNSSGRPCHPPSHFASRSFCTSSSAITPITTAVIDPITTASGAPFGFSSTPSR
jgi:hypothetical protein